MKRRLSYAMAAAMICGCIGGNTAVFAEENGIQQMQAFFEEIHAIEQAAVEGTVSVNLDGQEFICEVTAAVAEGTVSDVDVTFGVVIPDMDVMEITAEDIFCVTKDGFYLNIGSLLASVTELAGMDISEIAEGFGMTEDWIGFLAADMPALPLAAIEALTTDIEEKLADGMDMITVTEIENGYQMDLTVEDYPVIVNAVIEAVDRNLEAWLESGIDLLSNIDLTPFIDAYAVSVQEGISAVDDSFDGESFQGMCDSLKTITADLTQMLNADEIAEAYRASMDAVELSLPDGVALNSSYTVTKTEENGYEISKTDDFEIMGSSGTVNTVWKITPADVSIAEAPETYMDSKELVSVGAAMVYEYMMLSMLDGPGSVVESELIIDGNRIRIADLWEENYYWLEYDSEVLNLDAEYSSVSSIYMDIPNTYSYLSVGIEDSTDFAGYCEDQASWYETYEDFSMSEPVVLEGDAGLSYVVIRYSYEGWEMTEILFGADIDESVSVCGSFSPEDDMTEDDIETYISAAIVNVGKVE